MTTIREAAELKGAIKFKIHAITSVIGTGRSANNNVFYDTFEEAEAQVQKYLRQGDCEAFVIMTTCAIIKRRPAPTATYMVRDSGYIEEIN